jgi:hypothetical protein
MDSSGVIYPILIIKENVIKKKEADDYLQV